MVFLKVTGFCGTEIGVLVGCCYMVGYGMEERTFGCESYM